MGTARIALYNRALPGGGYVTIELTRSAARSRPPAYRGEVIVERRSELERRLGHAAPVVAVHAAATVDAVMDELFPVAHSNAEIARLSLRPEGASRAPGWSPQIAQLPYFIP